MGAVKGVSGWVGGPYEKASKKVIFNEKVFLRHA